MTMREFLNAIMQFISATSLTDEEYATTTSLPDEPGTYTVAVYNACLAILDSRELVTNTRDKLTFLFKAKGVQVEPTSKARSNIFIGSSLE